MKTLATILLLFGSVLPAADKVPVRPPPTPPPAPVESGLKLPAAVHGRVGQLVRIHAESPADVDWDAGDLLDAPEQAYVDAATHTLVVTAPKGGTYRVRAFSYVDGHLQRARCLVTIDDPATPTGLEVALRKAYGDDVAAKEASAADLAKLAELYRGELRAIDSLPADSVDALLRQLDTAEAIMVGKSLPRLRDAVSDHIDAELGRPGGSLRGRFADLLKEVIEALAKVIPGPGPGPGPQPPGPNPPTPNPIPAAGFRVLIVYESSELSKLPPSQLNVLYARSIREYLNEKCPKGTDGRTPEYRVWDQNMDATGESAFWQGAMGRKRASLPWIVIGDPDHGGYEGPLPGNVADTLALLKKYGG